MIWVPPEELRDAIHLDSERGWVLNDDATDEQRRKFEEFLAGIEQDEADAYSM